MKTASWPLSLPFCACLCLVASAQYPLMPNGLMEVPAGEWRTVDPGGDGEWFAYEMQPVSGTILVAGNMSHNLLRSTDGAKTFHPCMPKGDALQVYKLFPHPEQAGRWYALARTGKQVGGLYRSEDDSETWECLVNTAAAQGRVPGVHGFGCVIPGKEGDTVIVKGDRDELHIWRGHASVLEPFSEGLNGPSPETYEGDSTSPMGYAMNQGKPQIFTIWGDGLYTRSLSDKAWAKVPGSPNLEGSCVTCDRQRNIVYASFKPRGIGRLDLGTGKFSVVSETLPAAYLRTHPAKPGALWAFAGNATLIRTDDEGKTWRNLTRRKQCWNERYAFNYDVECWPAYAPFRFFAVDPKNPDILHLSDDMVSTDGGGSWKSGSRYLPETDSWRGNGLTLLTDYRIWFDECHPNRMYAGFSDTGLMMSEDRGYSIKRVRCYNYHTFSDVDSSLKQYDAYTTGSCMAFAVDPERSSTWYYAACGKGAEATSARGVCGILLKTTDDGRNWTPVVPWQSGLPNGIISDLLLLPHKGYEERKLYAVVNYVALKNGQPVPGSTKVDVNDLSPFLIESGLFGSEDSGRSWKRLAGQEEFRGAMPLMDIECAASDPQVMYAAGSTGVGKRPANSLRFPRAPGEYGGVFRSADGGISWESASGPEMANCVQVAIHPQDPATLFAACYNGTVRLADGKPAQTTGGVYRSRDSGKTWQCVLPSSQYVVEDGSNSWYGNGATSVAINPELPDIVFASMNLAGVFRSLDGGETWERVDWERFQRYQRNYHSLSINPHDPAELCLGLFGCSFVAYRDPVVIAQLDQHIQAKPNLLRNGDFETKGTARAPAWWKTGQGDRIEGPPILSLRESPSGAGTSLYAAWDASRAVLTPSGQRADAWAENRVSPWMLSLARGKRVRVSIEAWLESGNHDGARPSLLLVETRDGREYVISEIPASVAYGNDELSPTTPQTRRRLWVRYESTASVSPRADSLRLHLWACSKGMGAVYFDNARLEVAE